VKEKSPETHVLWIQPSNVAWFEADLCRVLEQLDIAGGNLPWADAMQLFKTWLNDRSNGNWLLVLDDLEGDGLLREQLPALKAERPTGKAILDYLPVVGHGTILCTSRSGTITQGIVNHINVVHVDVSWRRMLSIFLKPSLVLSRTLLKQLRSSKQWITCL
jgi:hypothetical protein